MAMIEDQIIIYIGAVLASLLSVGLMFRPVLGPVLLPTRSVLSLCAPHCCVGCRRH